MIGPMVLVLLPQSDVGATPYRTPVSQAIRTGCGPSWQHVNSPSPGTQNSLSGVSGASQGDTWAVGEADQNSLALHWNGHVWTKVTTPSTTGTLWAVHAVASNDVWAVGVGQNPTMHWDGRSWTSIPTPGFDGLLFGVDGVASTDVWAVGTTQDGGGQPVTLHWDGVGWTVVNGPELPYGGALNAVDVVGATDAWAVGFQLLSDLRTLQPFIEHWDGVEWTVSPSPSLTNSSSLSGVSGISDHNIWAVGSTDPDVYTSETLAERWDGSTWTVVPTPNPSASQNELTDVVTVDPGTVFAVGWFRADSGWIYPLLEQWDGQSWSGKAAPHRPGYNYFLGLGVIGRVRWAVGTWALPNPVSATLVEASCSA